MVITPIVNTAMPGLPVAAEGQTCADAFATILTAAAPVQGSAGDASIAFAPVAAGAAPLQPSVPTVKPVAAAALPISPVTTQAIEAPSSSPAAAPALQPASDVPLTVVPPELQSALAPSPNVSTPQPLSADVVTAEPQPAAVPAEMREADLQPAPAKEARQAPAGPSTPEHPLPIQPLATAPVLAATLKASVPLSPKPQVTEAAPLSEEQPTENRTSEPLIAIAPDIPQLVLPEPAPPQPGPALLPALPKAEPPLASAEVDTAQSAAPVAEARIEAPAARTAEPTHMRQVATALERPTPAASLPAEPEEQVFGKMVEPVVPAEPRAETAPIMAAATSAQTNPAPALAQVSAPAARTLPFRAERIGERMGVEVARAIKDGKEELVVRLDPAELGRINIRMRFDETGNLRAVVAAESAIVAEAIRRDTSELTRALTDAGVRADTQSFRFDRGGSGDTGPSGQWQQQRGSSHGRPFAGSDDHAPANDPAPKRHGLPLGRIDLIA